MVARIVLAASCGTESIVYVRYMYLHQFTMTLMHEGAVIQIITKASQHIWNISALKPAFAGANFSICL